MSGACQSQLMAEAADRPVSFTLPPGLSIKAQSWSAAGMVVAGYTESVQSALAPTAFVAPSAQSVGPFYCYTGGVSSCTNNAVSYSVTLSDGSGPFTGTTTFCVYSPSVTFTATAGSVVLCPPARRGPRYTNPAFAFGDYTYEINWTVKITGPPGGTGSVFMVQTVASTRTATLPTNVVKTLTTGSTNVLDASTVDEPVSIVNATVLSGQTSTATGDNEPGTGLASYVAYSAQDSFIDTVRYEPNGGIPVPLSMMSWGWIGAVKLISGVWTLTSSSHTTNPTGSSTTTFPFWTSYIGQYTFH